MSSKRDKRSIAPQKSNTNRSKSDQISQSPQSSQTSQSNVREDSGSSVNQEEIVKFPSNYSRFSYVGRQSLAVNNLNFLYQDGVLMCCFYLTMICFWFQMNLIYRQEYQHWNWKQFGISTVGILNIYASFSAERKKENLMTMLKNIWKAENKFLAIYSRLWLIIESDEVNVLFSNILVLTMLFVTFDHSVHDPFNIFIALNWIFTFAFINLKAREPKVVHTIFQSTFASFGKSTLAWPEQALQFMIEIVWIFIYTCISSIYFATIALRMTAYNTHGTLFLVPWELFVVSVFLLFGLIPLLVIYVVQVHRNQLFISVRELSRFYDEQGAPGLAIGDRIIGSAVLWLDRLLQREVRSITWYSGHSLTYIVYRCLQMLGCFILVLVLLLLLGHYSMTLENWLLTSIVYMTGSIAFILYYRPRYQWNTAMRLVQKRETIEELLTAVSDDNSPDESSPQVSPDGQQAIPPSKRMHSLFADNDTKEEQRSQSNSSVFQHSVYNIEQLEQKQKMTKDFLNSLTETFTYQQLQTSAANRKSSSTASSTTTPISASMASNTRDGKKGLSVTFSQTSLTSFANFSSSSPLKSPKVNIVPTSILKSSKEKAARASGNNLSVTVPLMQSLDIAEALSSSGISDAAEGKVSDTSSLPTAVSCAAADTPLPAVAATTTKGPPMLPKPKQTNVSLQQSPNHSTSIPIVDVAPAKPSKVLPQQTQPSKTPPQLPSNALTSAQPPSTGTEDQSNHVAKQQQQQQQQSLPQQPTSTSTRHQLPTNGNKEFSSAQQDGSTTRHSYQHHQPSSSTAASSGQPSPPSSQPTNIFKSQNSQVKRILPSPGSSNNSNSSTSFSNSHTTSSTTATGNSRQSTSSTGRLTIDVSAATLGFSTSAPPHLPTATSIAPSTNTAATTSTAAAPAAAVSMVPAVTVMSITHHGSGPIAATSITTTTTLPSAHNHAATTISTTATSSNHPPAPGLAQQRKSRSLDLAAVTSSSPSTSSSSSTASTSNQHTQGRSLYRPPKYSASAQASPTTSSANSSHSFGKETK